MCFFKCSADAARLSKGGLAFSLGLIKGLYLLGLAWLAWLTGYGTAMVNHINQFHPGFTPTLEGGLLGGLFGFICGFIFGFLIAFFYNLYVRCCRRHFDSNHRDVGPKVDA